MHEEDSSRFGRKETRSELACEKRRRRRRPAAHSERKKGRDCYSFDVSSQQLSTQQDSSHRPPTPQASRQTGQSPETQSSGRQSSLAVSTQHSQQFSTQPVVSLCFDAARTGSSLRFVYLKFRQSRFFVHSCNST